MYVANAYLVLSVRTYACRAGPAGQYQPGTYTRLLLHLVQILVERINELCLPHQCECHVTCHVEFHFIFIAFPVPEYGAIPGMISSHRKNLLSCEGIRCSRRWDLTLPCL